MFKKPFKCKVNSFMNNFHILTSSYYFRPVNIDEFLRPAFFIEHLQKQSFANILQNRPS